MEPLSIEFSAFEEFDGIYFGKWYQVSEEQNESERYLSLDSVEREGTDMENMFSSNYIVMAKCKVLVRKFQGEEMIEYTKQDIVMPFAELKDKIDNFKVGGAK